MLTLKEASERNLVEGRFIHAGGYRKAVGRVIDVEPGPVPESLISSSTVPGTWITMEWGETQPPKYNGAKIEIERGHKILEINREIPRDDLMGKIVTYIYRKGDKQMYNIRVLDSDEESQLVIGNTS